MKIKILTLLLMLSIFIPFGCSVLTPEHPTKSKSDYNVDKTDCDKKAREYAYNRVGSNNSFSSRGDGSQISEEMEYSRRCLKEKGWRYLKP